MTSKQPTIAIIEDNSDLREELTFFLHHRGYNCWSADSAERFWKKLHRNSADIVLVDVGLPGENGFSVVQYLADLGSFGVIIISARGQQPDRLRGLNLGADLYLVKPVNFSELASKIQALSDRMAQEQEQDQDSSEIPYRTEHAGAQWHLSASRQCLAAPGGETIQLSPQEYELLEILRRSAKEVFSKEALVDLMFHYDDDPDPHRIDVILSRLRKKARQCNINLPLRSIFGKGVVFVGQVTY